MGTIANVVCKTVGLAGMGAVLYDAYTLGKIKSSRGAAKETANHLTDVVAAQRTASSDSYVSSAIQNKTADLRMRNPLIPLIGRVKGFVNGTLAARSESACTISF